MSNPYSAYKKQSVTTMTPVEVVIKLYSETERQLAIGVNAIRTKEIKKAHESLMKAQELLGALRGSLDMDVPVSKNLDQLYEFFQRTAEKANIRKDEETAAEVEKIIPMVGELWDAFTQISQMTKEEIEAQEKSRKK